MRIRPAPLQKSKSIRQPVIDLGWRHAPDQDSSQLDCERDSIEGAADTDNRSGVLAGELEIGVSAPCPGPEQLNRLRLPNGVGIGNAARRRQGERRNWPRHLAGHLQRLAARCQYTSCAGLLQELADYVRAGCHEVLAVIEHQESGLCREALEHDRTCRPRALHYEAERRADRVRNTSWVQHRAEVDQPHLRRLFCSELRCDFERKPGLTDTADSKQRDQTVLAEEAPHRRDRLATSYEASQLDRQIAEPRRTRCSLKRAVVRQYLPQESLDVGARLHAELLAKAGPQALENV